MLLYINVIMHIHVYTENCKIVIVKIFSDSMGSATIKRTNIMRIINANAVRVVCPKINRAKYF